MRERAVYAHCIHFDADDRALMRQRHTAAAVCPTSNLFLGSGFFDFAAAEDASFAHGLASDVGGGTSFSPFRTLLAAYEVGREGQTKPGLSLSASRLWWLHTAGAAAAHRPCALHTRSTDGGDGTWATTSDRRCRGRCTPWAGASACSSARG
jgi:guanine deaminase